MPSRWKTSGLSGSRRVCRRARASEMGCEIGSRVRLGLRSRTVGRQIAERGADWKLDRLADAGHFVCAEVIGDDDVPGMHG